MKTPTFTPIVSIGLALFALNAPAQDAPAPSTTDAVAQAVSGPPSATKDGLRFNFRGAPLEMVLNYMSEAAGYIIVLDTPVRGTVDMWSAQPISKAEAVQLLNIALNKNGYSATVQGRSLVISSKEDAKKKNIPIHTGNDPRDIPLTAEMVVQIIPLRHIDATTTARDLGTLLPGSTAITPNEDSNSLVVTDTQINIHHVVELVAALDTSMEGESAMKVFRLKNADPMEMATLVTNVYGSPTTTPQNGNNRGNGGGGFNPANRFAAAAALFGGGAGGAGGFNPAGAAGGAAGGGGFGGGGGRRNGGNNNQARQATPVVAIPDPRTLSVIVTASKDVMPQITDMIGELDSNAGRKQNVYVYTLENGDVQQAETILKNLFQTSNSRSSTTNQVDPLVSRAQTNAQSTTTANSLLNINSTSGRSR